MNTKLVVALFVGAVSAKQLPNINMLTVQTSDAGVRALDNQGKKLEQAWDHTADSKTGLEVQKSAAAWFQTKEAQEFVGVFDHASRSNEAERLHGHADALHNSVTPLQNGAHINNDVLEARLHSIELELDHIEHETSFKADVEAAYRKSAATQEAGHLAESLHAWEYSQEHQQFKNVVDETKGVVGQYVQVSDLPKAWQHQIARRAQLNLIDVTVQPAGQQAILKEHQDVEYVANTLEKDPAFADLAQAATSWSQSAEVQASVKQLEDFSKTQQAHDIQVSGQALQYELEGAVSEIPNGVRVANSKLPAIETRVKNLEAKLKVLQPTPQMESAFRSSSWKNVEAKGQAFEASAKGYQLKKELEELANSLQTHVKVTDVPK